MTDCSTCIKIKNESMQNIIEENENAIGIASDYFREGHCSVIVKRHIKSVTELTTDEYTDIFKIIKRVSKALEYKYKTDKTYLISIGDQVDHFHIHLIPKHKDKCSMGVYCFGKLFEAEGERKPTLEEQIALRDELRTIITSQN